MSTFALVVYAVFGVLALIAGATALVMPNIALPADARTHLARHLVREEAAAFVFIGIMLLGCLRNAERRRPVHIAMLVFTGLFAVIHWLPALEDGRLSRSAIINTLPFLVFAATMPRGGAAGEPPARPGAMVK